MNTIGFSTGALAKGDFHKALAALFSSRADAVEVSALREPELSKLMDAWLAKELSTSKYKFVAIHAPSSFTSEKSVIAVLAKFTAEEPNVKIVAHPDTIKDFSLWKSLNGALCIENMDSRKPTGRTAAELREIFAKLPDARLCFDIGHARHVDPTMLEARRIIKEFGGRLSHVHMSEVDAVGGHHPISRLAQRAFEDVYDAIPQDVPVILESTVAEDRIDEELTIAGEVVNAARRRTV